MNQSPTRKFIRQAISMIVLLLCIGIMWELIKVLGGDPWWADKNPLGLEFRPPFKWKFASDLNLPHLWDIFNAFGQPSRRNGPPLINTLIFSALFTFREAVVGFAIGALLGFILGTLFAHVPFMERGCMPYVVASQTIPILAIAPMVIIWLKAGWVSVAVISAYLTFFPVTINTLRGLKSPDPLAIDLMNSYAASRWDTLWKLRVPAALPYIFTALKVSATASIVGAIIGELPSGIRDGLGRAILTFMSQYSTGPSRLWATIIMSAIVGIFFFLVITLAEWLVLRGRYRPVEDV